MKVLVIDRVKIFQKIIAEVLSNTGIDHSLAVNGADALEQVKKDSFQCICVSLHLDDINGIELCKKIRRVEGYKHTPIVLLTTESNHEVLREALHSGITDIFLKDKINELVNFIDRFTQVTKPIEGKVLYIEDQRSQREYVTSMFKARNLKVDAFENAEDAWEAFLKKSYHLVLTDIVLEGEISGILLINKIRRLDGIKGDIPILAITAFDDTSRRLSLYHMGITDYLTKPIMEEELVARVKNLITSQRTLEKEIKFREQLSSGEMVRRSQKMEAMGKLIGGIVHDYNNMQCIISGYTEILHEKLEDDPEAIKHLQQISKAGNSATMLTRKLLKTARRDSDDPELIDIKRLLDDMHAMIAKTMTSGIELSITTNDNIWPIFGDLNDLENALLNMCINAKHAMANSGQLNIIATNRVLGLSESEAFGLPPGHYVQLSIKDTGHGMTEETLHKVFDPFFTTKGENGSGLGLSQVYGFMQRSKGAVAVKSTPEKGSIFNLYFPRCDKAPEKRKREDPHKAMSLQHKDGAILIVDEEQAICELMKRHLKESGYHVCTANNAAQANQLLNNNQIDLMICETIIPGGNGYELAEQVKINHPDIKVIMSTGYGNFEEDSRREHYRYQLQKPISKDVLLNTVLLAFS